MALMELEGRYFDPSVIASILPIEANKSSGMFEFKSETLVTLKTGKEIRTTLSGEEIVARSKEAVERPVTENQNTTLDLEEFRLLAEDLLTEVKKMNEHLHTVSECLIRYTMPNTKPFSQGATPPLPPF